MSLTKVSFHLLTHGVSPATSIKGHSQFNPEGNINDHVAVSINYLKKSKMRVVDLLTAKDVIASITRSHLMKTGRVLKSLAIYGRISTTDDEYNVAFVGAIEDLVRYYPIYEHDTAQIIERHQSTRVTKFRHISHRSSLVSLLNNLGNVHYNTDNVVIVPQGQDIPANEPDYNEVAMMFARPPSSIDHYDWDKYKYFMLDMVNERVTEIVKEGYALNVWENA